MVLAQARSRALLNSICNWGVDRYLPDENIGISLAEQVTLSNESKPTCSALNHADISISSGFDTIPFPLLHRTLTLLLDKALSSRRIGDPGTV